MTTETTVATPERPAGTAEAAGTAAAPRRRRPAAPVTAGINEVRLVGRVAAAPEERTLPSGDRMVSLRVVVDRPAAGRGERTSRQRVDSVECTVWQPRTRRCVIAWRPGDLVEVTGALRRRFFRSNGGAVASRVEVEVATARVIRRSVVG